MKFISKDYLKENIKEQYVFNDEVFRKVGYEEYDSYTVIYYNNSFDESYLENVEEVKNIELSYDTEYYTKEDKRVIVNYTFMYEIENVKIFVIIIMHEEVRLPLSNAIEIIYNHKESGLKVLQTKGDRYKTNKKDELQIELISHYNVVDLSAFLDFDFFKKKTMVIINSLINNNFGVKGKFYNYKGYKSRRYSRYAVSFSDTLNLAPPKHRSLNSISKSLGFLDDSGFVDFSKETIIEAAYRDFDKYMIYNINDVYTVLEYTRKIKTMFNIEGVLPVTLGKISETNAIEKLKDILDVETNKDFNIVFRGIEEQKRGDSVKILDLVYTNNAKLIQEDSITGYLGGLSNSFHIGYFKDKTYDYDLRSAYPLVMSLLRDVDFTKRNNMKIYHGELDIKDFNLNDYGGGYIDFEFPEGVWPTLPIISLNARGHIFPRKGYNVYATIPEIYMALYNGAKITTVGKGVVVYEKTDKKSLSILMKELIKDRNEIVTKYGKGSLEEDIQKIINNLVYGKISQGVSAGKLVRSGGEDKGISKITNPVYANQITALTRSIMVFYLNELEKLGYKVYSITVDGFITNAPEEVVYSLEIPGIDKEMKEIIKELTEGKENHYITIKKEQNELINIKTKGNVGLGNEESLEYGVFAKANYSIDKRKYANVTEQKIDFIDMLLNQEEENRTVFERVELPNVKEYLRKDKVEPIASIVSINVDFSYDFKNKPIKRYYTEVLNPKTNKKQKYLNLTLEPWETIEEFENFRDIKESRELRINSYESYDELMFRYLTHQKDVAYLKSVQRTVLMNLLTVYYQGGFKRNPLFEGTRKEVVENINENYPELRGYVTENDIKTVRTTRHQENSKTLEVKTLVEIAKEFGVEIQPNN